MSTYKVENQWGGNTQPWHQGGVFVLGCRDSKPQNVVAMDISSPDGGRTLTGTMTYAGEGPIGFRASLIGNNNYLVENQWGGSTAPWRPGGQWVIGARLNQPVVELKFGSQDGGATLAGTMTYAGEGPIGFKANDIGRNLAFQTENQWGGNTAPWHQGGVFVLGCRPEQNVVAVDITSDDGGRTFTGAMTYAGEGPIGFRATLLGAGLYTVENQWGGNGAEWHPGGMWLIGFRAGQQNVVALDIQSSDGGETFTGTLTYSGEGPIGFQSRNMILPAIAQEITA